MNSSRYILCQGLSTIDVSSAMLFVMAYDAKHVPVLLSLPLDTGVPSVVLTLPFGEDDTAIGANQIMAFAPDLGRVIVGGVTQGGSVELATVDPATQNYSAFATLPANISIALDTSQAAYLPSTKTMIMLTIGNDPPYTRQIAAVSLATGSVELLENGLEPRVNTIDYDPVTGDAFGLGTTGDDESTRVIVRIAAKGLGVSTVGTVQGYSDSLGGFSALDYDTRSIYWLGAESGNDDGFYILNVALTPNATVLSTGLACVSSLSCITTFEYYSSGSKVTKLPSQNVL